VIPILDTLALGSQRLLPALQQVYGGWALICAYRFAVVDVLAMLDLPMPADFLRDRQRPLQLEVAVDLHQLSYR
jgi:ATP-binding cassette subfamily B protein